MYYVLCIMYYVSLSFYTYKLRLPRDYWEQINTPLLRCHPDRLTIITSRRNTLFVRMPRGCSSDQSGVMVGLSGLSAFSGVLICFRVLGVDDQGALAHGVAAVAHLALAGADLLGVDHALELLAAAERLERLHNNYTSFPYVNINK